MSDYKGHYYIPSLLTYSLTLVCTYRTYSTLQMSGNADEQMHTIYNLIASWHECDETWKEAEWTIKLFQENGGIKFCNSKRHREGSKKPSQLQVGLSTENALPNVCKVQLILQCSQRTIRLICNFPTLSYMQSINVTNITAMDYPQKGSQKVLFGTEKEH